MLNALTIDLEDWYQVANLEHLISFDDWDRCEDRLEMSVGRLLDLFRANGAKATFFVLGWNAERKPDLMRQIAREGHELATHGYSHKLIYKQQPAEFAEELKRSVDAIENATGQKVMGHRAASFSITEKSTWALDILAEQGIAYDSSIFPVRHPRYGIPDAPRTPYVARRSSGSLVEFPVSTVQFLGKNVPFSGGAYFRFLPSWFVHKCMRMLNRRGVPVMFYLHPWEVDPGQPRMDLDWKLGLRCYHNIEATERRLSQLLDSFEFGRARDVLQKLHSHGLEESGRRAGSVLRYGTG